MEQAGLVTTEKVGRVRTCKLVVTRTFNGPARIVFEAWTKPEPSCASSLRRVASEPRCVPSKTRARWDPQALSGRCGPAPSEQAPSQRSPTIVPTCADEPDCGLRGRPTRSTFRRQRFAAERLIAELTRLPPPVDVAPAVSFDELVGDGELGVAERIFIVRHIIAFFEANMNSVATLAHKMVEIRKPAGEVLWRDGDPSEHSYFVVQAA